MDSNSAPCIILMADDDPDDCLLARIAFEQSAIEGEIRFVVDGRELIEYLQNGGEYTFQDKVRAPTLSCSISTCLEWTDVKHSWKSNPIRN